MAGIIQQRMPKDPNKVAGYESDKINLGESDFVENRLDRVINKDSPLMQSARTSAKQDANRKGLLNSSMAIEAGQKAVIDRALPIASQDAQTSFQGKVYNQNAENTERQYNAGNIADRQMQSADIQGRSRLQREAGNIEKGLIQERGKVQKALQRAEGELRERLLNRQGQIDRELQHLRGQQAQRMEFLNRKTQERLQGMRGEQAERLAEIENKNRLQIQSSQSASMLYAQTSASMSEILGNPEIPREQKQSLINKQLELLDNGLGLMGEIGDMDFGGMLNFDKQPGRNYAAGGIPNLQDLNRVRVQPYQAVNSRLASIR